MNTNEKWLQWAVELQSIAQAGLFYGKDPFDLERYERIREISAEMISYKTEIPLEKVKDLFCNEAGYQTTKLDTRATIFRSGKERKMVTAGRLGKRGCLSKRKYHKRG